MLQIVDMVKNKKTHAGLDLTDENAILEHLAEWCELMCKEHGIDPGSEALQALRQQQQWYEELKHDNTKTHGMLEEQNAQLNILVAAAQAKGRGKGREDKVQVQRRADIKDGPEDVLVLYFDEDISQYVYEDQSGGQKYPVEKENVQFKELRNAKVHILETEGVTKQTAAKYAKYKNLKGLIISDPDPKKKIILDPETEIEVQLTNKYVTKIPWKFIKLLPIDDDMEDALSAAEPKTYRITSEKDSYHDFIGSGTLINAETVKLTLRGLNHEYAIPLAKVQEVSQDAVGKFDLGSKLQLSESFTRGPLKRFKGRTAAVTSWAGDKVTLQFQSGEFTFEAMKHIQYFKYFTKNEAKEESNYPRDEIESSSEASSQLTDDSLADDSIDDSQSLVSEADWHAAIGDIGATVKSYEMAKGLPRCLHLERALARANLEVMQ